MQNYTQKRRKMSLAAHICTQNVFVDTKTIGEEKIQKSIFYQQFSIKIGFWLFLAKMSSRNRKNRIRNPEKPVQELILRHQTGFPIS